MRVDFHVHTTAGGGKNTPAEMAAVAKKRGLDAIAITDTGTLDGWKKFNPRDFIIIPGVEIETDKGRVMVYGMNSLPGSTELESVIKWAKGGLLVPAQFNDKDGLGDSALDFDVVEAIRGTSPPWVCKDAVKKCTASDTKFFCNSGARSVSGLGNFYTKVPRSEDWEGILKAIKRGEFEPRLKFPSMMDVVRSKLL